MRQLFVALGLLILWPLLTGCGKTMVCSNGTITLDAGDDLYHGQGVVLTNGMTVERCMQIRQELSQLP